MMTFANADSSITREFNTLPIRMTYEDLSGVLNDVKALLIKTNKESPHQREEEISLSISAGEDTINIRNWEDLSRIKGLPKVGRSIRFRYELYGAAISTIEIILTDGVREVSISGSDSSQISAFTSYLKDKFDTYNTYYGGMYFRLFGAAVLLIIASILLNIRRGKSNSVAPIPIVTGIIIFTSVFVLPWDTWFPGVAVYAESASFIDRNINIISFLGVLATIAIPLAGFVAQGVKNKSRGQST